MISVLLSAFIIQGPSQTGKSSIINSIAGKNIAKIGNGNGESVTTNYSVYNIDSNPYISGSVSLIDTPGFDDSRLFISNEQIKEKLKIAILENHLSFKGVIVTESITSPSLQLNNTLEKLFQLYSEKIINSIIVVATHSDMIAYSENFKIKFKELEKFCDNKKIPFVKWSNNLDKLSENKIKTQTLDLVEAMQNIQKFEPKWIEEMDNEVNEIAKRIRNNLPKPSQQQIVELAKKIAINADLIKKDEIELYTETEKRTETYTTKSGGFFGLFKKKKYHTRVVNVPVTKSRTKTVYVKPDYQTFLKDAEEQLQPPPIEKFIDEARKIKLDEIRKKLIESKPIKDL